MYWMTGYSKYLQGMNNTISNIYTMNFSIAPTGLDYLKHWIADHGNDETTGGLAIIGVNTAGWVPYSIIPAGSPHAGERYISSFGTPGSGHALTIVGYNDEILIQDINGDGQYTNDRDVNGDGIFNIKDFEKGAFKVANSWGLDWTYGNQGFSFIPYKLLYPGCPGLGTSYAYACEIFPNEVIPSPKITVKASVEHPERNELSIKVGYAATANSTDPVATTNYNSFNSQGGPLEMRGVYDGPLELGLNYGYFYENTQFGKVFFRVNEVDNMSNSSGNINYFSLIDHRWGEDFELYCSQTNVPIVNNGNTTLSIEYHLLPHHDDLISQNLYLGSNRVSRFTTTVTNGATLSVGNGVHIDMYNSEIHISEGSEFNLGANANIIARRGNCKITIDGNLVVHPGVHFIAEGDATLEIYLNNSTQPLAIQYATFGQCKIYSKIPSLTISTSTFTNCKSFYSYYGDVVLSDNTLTNTGLYIENKSKNQNLQASVSRCTFTNTLPEATAIRLINYGKYNLAGNTIQDFYDGIDLFGCGSGPAGYQKIENNTIHGSEMNAIIAYNTIGSIYKNNIYNNNFGVRLMNSCNIALYGNPEAQSLDQTQQIRDNTSFEVYASEFSFPYYFRYNSIVDNDNLGKPNDPLLLFDRPVYANVIKEDVTYNHWGSGFNAGVDLMGNNAIFLSSPIWNPGGSISTFKPDEDLYTSAFSNFEAGNYAVAKNLYQLLIELYPKSTYAEAAIKDLVRLEEYAGKEYADLKDYLLSNDSISADTTLSKLASVSANQCDVKMENWPSAISWYENHIENPESLADSVFAVIDLGYVYLLMEDDSLKAQFIGRMPEYKPVSKASFVKNKSYLLSLLPGNTNSPLQPGNLTYGKDGSLSQNSPNPSKGQTTIVFTLERECNVELLLSDMSGREIKKVIPGVKPAGTHTFQWNLKPIASGMYVYSLILDGKLADVKKMSVSN